MFNFLKKNIKMVLKLFIGFFIHTVNTVIYENNKYKIKSWFYWFLGLLSIPILLFSIMGGSFLAGNNSSNVEFVLFSVIVFTIINLLLLYLAPMERVKIKGDRQL